MAVEDILIGLQYKAYVDATESESTPVWSELPNQFDCNFNTGQTKVDATTKQGSGWRQQVGVGKQWDADCNGALEESDTALDYLDTFKKHATMHKRMHIRIRRISDNMDIIGWAFADISYSFPPQEKATYSIAWEGDGAFTESVGS